MESKICKRLLKKKEKKKFAAVILSKIAKIASEFLAETNEADSPRSNLGLLWELLLETDCNINPPFYRSAKSVVERSDFWEVEVPKFTSKKFKDTFRVNRDTFQFLVDKLGKLQKQNTNWRLAIPLPKRVAVCMYALASTDEIRTVGSLFGVGASTVYKMLGEFSREVWDTLQKDYLCAYPVSRERVLDNVKHFEEMGFPQVFAAIGGCHVQVQPPKKDAADYLNFKKFNSIVLFAAVDYRCRFLYISVGTPGRTSDSVIFENGRLKEQHVTDSIFKDLSKVIEGVSVPVLLLGDSAFPLSEIVMKPFPFLINQDPAEKLFNRKLSSCRRVVENAFGHLQARFRRIGTGLEVSVPNVIAIVKACCVLHNIASMHNDQVSQSWIEAFEQTDQSDQSLRPEIQNPESPAGVAIRESIKAYLFQSE